MSHFNENSLRVLLGSIRQAETWAEVVAQMTATQIDDVAIKQLEQVTDFISTDASIKFLAPIIDALLHRLQGVDTDDPVAVRAVFLGAMSQVASNDINA